MKKNKILISNNDVNVILTLTLTFSFKEWRVFIIMLRYDGHVSRFLEGQKKKTVGQTALDDDEFAI